MIDTRTGKLLKAIRYPYGDSDDPGVFFPHNTFVWNDVVFWAMTNTQMAVVTLGAIDPVTNKNLWMLRKWVEEYCYIHRNIPQVYERTLESVSDWGVELEEAEGEEGDAEEERRRKRRRRKGDDDNGGSEEEGMEGGDEVDGHKDGPDEEAKVSPAWPLLIVGSKEESMGLFKPL